MREALDSRAQLPRHQGPALWDGDGRDPHRRAGATGSAAADQRVRDGAADHAGDGGRELGDGSTTQVQHIKDAHALAIPPGVHALRTDPEHARASAAAADAAVRANAGQQRVVRRISVGGEMRGWMSLWGASAEQYKASCRTNLLPYMPFPQLCHIRCEASMHSYD